LAGPPQPESEAAEAEEAAEAAALSRIPAPLFSALFRGLAWGHWAARGALLARALGRQAACDSAAAAELAQAAPPGPPPEQAAAVAALWRLQPFVPLGEAEAWAAVGGRPVRSPQAAAGGGGR